MKNLYSQLSGITKLTFLCLSILLIPAQSYARDISFAWIANPEPVTGYKIYYKTGTDGGPPYDGTDLNNEGSPILLGNTTTTTLTGLSPDETYQFTVTAYNDTEESTYSTVISIPPESPLSSPTIMMMSHN